MEQYILQSLSQTAARKTAAVEGEDDAQLMLAWNRFLIYQYNAKRHKAMSKNMLIWILLIGLSYSNMWVNVLGIITTISAITYSVLENSGDLEKIPKEGEWGFSAWVVSM